jgi:hypothetical protein
MMFGRGSDALPLWKEQRGGQEEQKSYKEVII